MNINFCDCEVFQTGPSQNPGSLLWSKRPLDLRALPHCYLHQELPLVFSETNRIKNVLLHNGFEQQLYCSNSDDYGLITLLVSP